jgi:hypothetical protein
MSSSKPQSIPVQINNVVDIRFARVKKLSRAFFADLNSAVPDDRLVPMAFEFIETLRGSGQVPTAPVKRVILKHAMLVALLDTLRSEKVRRNRP